MRPTKIWANLGVEDVKKTWDFYNKLGFKRNQGHDNGKDIASFLVGDDDFVVHFFQKERLKEFIDGKIADLSQGSEVIFTLWAGSKGETDAWADEVRNAGGNIFSEPAEFGDGYYGYGFSDPDGHKWNVFHM